MTSQMFSTELLEAEGALITAVHVTVTCSYISAEVQVKRKQRLWCKYAIDVT